MCVLVGCRLQSTADLLAASNLSSEPRRPPTSQPGSLFTNFEDVTVSLDLFCSFHVTNFTSPQPISFHPDRTRCDWSAVAATANCVASQNLSVVCLSRVRSRKLSKIDAKFRNIYRKSGSPTQNMTSDFTPEVAKYPKSSPKFQNSPKLGCR